MDLSVIIVSMNVRQMLSDCLDSVYACLSPSSLQYDVWVVDNASTDDSVPMVRQRHPQVRLLANECNRGFAAANNQALAQSTGQVCILLNPDTLVLDDALLVLTEFINATSRAGIAAPRLVYGDGSFQHSAFHFPSLAQVALDFFPLHHRLLDSRLNGRYPRRTYDNGRPFAIDHPLGACMAVPRAALDQVGPLDEQYFMYCEEVDWAWRMHRDGWGVFCVPAARIVHLGAQSTRQFRNEMFVALWRSRFLFFRKYYGAVFCRAVGALVRAGLRAEAGRARQAQSQGKLTADQLAARQAALEEVRALSDA